MSNRNYTPAEWQAESDLSQFQGRANDGVWDGRFEDGSRQDFHGQNRLQNRPRPQPQPQQRPPQNIFYDQQGRRCRVVCEPINNIPSQQELRRIGNTMIGRTIHQAQRIYPNTRLVISNGQRLPITMDHNPSRINVESRNGVIVRIDGFY